MYVAAGIGSAAATLAALAAGLLYSLASESRLPGDVPTLASLLAMLGIGGVGAAYAVRRAA